MIRSWPSLVIGLLLPAAALLLGVPLVAHTEVYVFGIPLLFFWTFLCFPFTTACLWVSWRFFDRKHYPDEEER